MGEAEVLHFCFISQNSADVRGKQWLWENGFLMNYGKEIAEIMMGGSSFTLLPRSASEDPPWEEMIGFRKIQNSREILITREKITFQVTWASSNDPFYSHIFCKPLSHPLLFSHIPLQPLFSQGSVPAPGEFSLSLSIDLNVITSGLMSSFGRDSKALMYSKG